MSSGPRASRRSAIARCGVIGSASAAGARRELLEQRGPEVGVDEGLAGLVPLPGVAATDPTGLDRGEEPAERAVDVADQLDLGPVLGVDLGRLGVDVDDPLAAVGVPAGRRVLDEVVADADHEIRPVEPGQDVVAGLEPDGHQRQVRPVVDRALAHERRRDRDVETAGEGAQLRRGAAAEHAVAGEDERSLGRRDQVGGVGDRLVGRLGEVGLARARAAARRRRRRVAATFSGSSMWVGPGLLEDRDAERLADDLGDRLDPLDAGVPLRDRLDHPDDVDDLVGFLVELVGAGLAGDRDHRRPIEEGVGDAGDEVGRARPERRHRDRGAAGEPAVDVGHERRALLVAGGDVARPAVRPPAATPRARRGRPSSPRRAPRRRTRSPRRRGTRRGAAAAVRASRGPSVSAMPAADDRCRAPAQPGSPVDPPRSRRRHWHRLRVGRAAIPRADRLAGAGRRGRQDRSRVYGGRHRAIAGRPILVATLLCLVVGLRSRPLA